MAAQPMVSDEHVDLSLELSGGPLPRDHSFAIWAALVRVAPALADMETLAILPVRAAASALDTLALQRRSRLLMRLPESGVGAVLALSGREILVDGTTVSLGKVRTRPLAPHPTLYTHRVAADRDGEAAFVTQIGRQLDRLGVRSEFIVGKRTQIRGPDGPLAGYSLMLVELSARQSLALQASGLGAHRRLGFGIFLGHK